MPGTGEPTRRRWTSEELEEAWTLGPDEHALLATKRGPTRLGFALVLRFFAREGRFPALEEIDEDAVEYVASQVDIDAAEYRAYDHRGRTSEYHRAQIREAFGFRPAIARDADEMALWLLEEVAPYEYDADRLKEAAYARLRSLKIEPPTPSRVDRMVRSALRSYDERFCETTLGRLSENSVDEMDALLSEPEVSAEDAASDGAGGRTSQTQPTLARLRNDPGRASAESARTEIAKLSRLRGISLPDDLFRNVSPKVVRAYRRRAASESPSSLRAHPPAVRYTLLSALCFMRLREVTDGLVEVLIQIVHKIGARSEKKIEKVLLEDFKKVSGKNGLLFRVAEAALSNPDGLVREVVFPVVGEEVLSKVVKEAKSTGAAYQEQVQLKMRSSYVSYYRPVISAVLGSLEFRSNNAAHRPIIRALGLLKAYAGSTKRFYEDDDDVPVEGVVPAGWHELVFKTDGKGPDRNRSVRNNSARTDRVVYELCVLGALRDGLRSKEIWVVGADRYRNPDEDLPQDFDERRERYYEALGQPMEADKFIEALQQKMSKALGMLDENVPNNPYLRLREKGNARISLSPLPAQAEPPNLDDLGIEIAGRWPWTCSSARCPAGTGAYLAGAGVAWAATAAVLAVAAPLWLGWTLWFPSLFLRTVGVIFLLLSVGAPAWAARGALWEMLFGARSPEEHLRYLGNPPRDAATVVLLGTALLTLNWGILSLAGVYLLRNLARPYVKAPALGGTPLKPSIVIPTLNEQNNIGPLLSDIELQTRGAYEVIVVDGRSTDMTASVVKDFPDVKLLEGFPPVAEQRNLGGEVRNDEQDQAAGEQIPGHQADGQVLYAIFPIQNTIRYTGARHLTARSPAPDPPSTGHPL